MHLRNWCSQSHESIQLLNWCSQTSKCSQFCKHHYKYVTLYIYNMPNKECSQFPQNQIYKIMKASNFFCKFKFMCKAQNYVNDNGITKAHICLINIHKITSNWFTWWANSGHILLDPSCNKYCNFIGQN